MLYLLYIYISIHVDIYISKFQYLYPDLDQYQYLYLYLSIYLSIYLPTYIHTYIYCTYVYICYVDDGGSSFTSSTTAPRLSLAAPWPKLSGLRSPATTAEALADAQKKQQETYPLVN